MNTYDVTIDDILDSIVAQSHDAAAVMVIRRHFEAISPPYEWEVKVTDEQGTSRRFTIYAKSEDKYEHGDAERQYIEWTIIIRSA